MEFGSIIYRGIKYIYIDDTTLSVQPADNTEYRYRNNVVSLTLSIPENISKTYASYLVFTSGETATEVIYPDSIKWSGDDVIDGIFAPLSSHRYNIGIWYDGAIMNAVARSVSV